MSTKVPQNNDEQEIDLLQISKKINVFFDGINRSIFRGIQFFVRNWIIVLILVVGGFGFGFFLDKTQKQYESEIIVRPNFDSVDYLYSKIDLLNSKVKENDTVYLKSIGIMNSLEIKKIELEPIVDIYKFIDNNEQNLQLLKLMAEYGDLKTVVKETTTSKNYLFHNITISTNTKENSNSYVQAVLKYLNVSSYYKEVQKIRIENIKQKIKENTIIIAQIDGILNEFSSTSSNLKKSDKLVYYNENTQLNDIIKTKETLGKEIGNLKFELLNSDKIIKENSVVLNVQKDGTLNNKFRFIFPLFFILGFSMITFFIKFYNNQKALSSLNPKI
ncbi:hypothetical protein [Flavobacterium taihuense]|uniref:Polysaccharide chain length determinant N-terminal domain-containing protein n=1 Tax=Flavobacterium taihuense TaxID=2857508 RepID=A0ABS6XSP7_9FLAO|nr:hypothetical protein [Flavobacterium taihuense]MBW4358923.1 hypothetical protein [Flavobacterium taihuense]